MEQGKVLEVIKKLKNKYPRAKYYLSFSTPLELLVAAILSAQVRDEAVNALTPALFKKYQSAEDYADADLDELVIDIKTISFAGKKARNIQNACKIIMEKHDGKVPRTMEELTSLPGVGRKTANTILINAFNIVKGIPADTHVIRLSQRLGWTTARDGDGVEKDLMIIIPGREWKKIPYMLKAHGKAICTPTPDCSVCFLYRFCPRAGVDSS